MRRHTIVLAPGDGVGPEVVEMARRAVEATAVKIEWQRFEAGAKAVESFGTPLPDAILQAIRECGVALKGPVATPVGTGFPSVNVGLRRSLGLYANLRPVRSFAGFPCRYEAVDLVIIRENTEGLYSGVERRLDDDTAEAVRRVTRSASLRIAHFAFDYARRKGRRAVTAVHKANILKLSDGLFLECARHVAADYPEIDYRERIVDALCMDLVIDPGRHDVLLCPNLYGDIVSDLAAGLIGGLGLVPGANIGDGIAVFEAVHGSAPDIAGKGIANPTALLLAGAMMLSYLGEEEASEMIEVGVRETYAGNGHLTPDVGGTANTREMTAEVLRRIDAQMKERC